MRFFTFCSVVTLLLVLGSCQRQESDPDVIVTLPPEFTVDLFEQRDTASGYPTFGLWVESLSACLCSNCGISATVNTAPSSIAVKILGTSEPALCNGPAASAKQFIPIGNLQNGIYAFSIALGQTAVIVNKGTLHIQDGRYQLDMPEVQGIEIGNYLLHHIPDHYVWGYAASKDSSLQAINDFLRELKNQTEAPDLEPGFYGYFTVTGTGNLVLHKQLILPNFQTESFLRKLNTPVTGLRPLLKGYRNASQGALRIRLLSTEGEI